MSVRSTAAIRCGRCKKPTAAKAISSTKVGPRCKRCADRLAPHQRR